MKIVKIKDLPELPLSKYKMSLYTFDDHLITKDLVAIAEVAENTKMSDYSIQMNMNGDTGYTNSYLLKSSNELANVLKDNFIIIDDIQDMSIRGLLNGLFVCIELGIEKNVMQVLSTDLKKINIDEVIENISKAL